MESRKIALITGSSRGLGRDMALRLAEKGFRIVLTYKTGRTEAGAVASQIEQTGGSAISLHLDMEQLDTYEMFFNNLSISLQEKWGVDKFDCLVNNAGMGQTIPFLQATESDFDRFMKVHFKGVFFFTQKALALMNDEGSIVNISTGTTRFCVPGYSIYASMKGAIETFTRYLAKEIGSRGINVNVLAPGPIETDFNNAAIRNNPQGKAFMAGNTALGRVGDATDIGGIVAFLCSPDAKWINGQRIEASGGINL
ncbi:MAG: SDR family oxidoreductase [Bacteroidetes bacterium]|nr:SDR family oxidoreductase [Bacteroidota bacterium]